MKEFDAVLNHAYLYWGPNLLLVYRDNLLIITKTKDWEHSLCSWFLSLLKRPLLCP